MQLWI